ncbi:efflux RND transporter permease subunit [Paludibaculum fermentans]|uniref:Efflux RND transporter permease subunit n=1 Tax=Paludibaculum fermentans TaxID=1473598 RepID=A0A7S7SN81_PALFE|nr:efflux RND transporter permease subunit [Paludibaculum fermentans]QOY89815.1 efflux RND transporter permease subunit [Paludibaculum fermentans]
MNFSEIFIRRPVATTLLMLAIALFGSVAYQALPVSDLPNVDFPTLMVSASLPGANPETMASAVATPLERQFSTIAGLDSMTSSNSLGVTSVTLQFDMSRELDGAAQDVQAAIAQASPLLPAGMPTPPTFRKVNPADQPVIFLALSSKSMPLYQMNEFADTMMAQRISMVSGVAQVQVFGSQKYAVRVQVSPREMNARGIGIDEVEAAIRKHNVNLPTGTLYGPDRMLTVQATGQLTSAEAYKPLVVAYKNGAPVRLEELATVFDSVEEDKIASWFNTHEKSNRAIVLAVQRQPGTNAMEVANSVRELLPSFRLQLPPAAMLDVLYDRSDTIRESFVDIQFTMALTLALVVMVIFLFLRKLSATVIPSLALPFSLIGTFSVMYLCGYSLDNLSLMALILAIGFVVDDAIVMLENIVRHMEDGEGPMEAALNGSREVGFTIVSMTISLAAVFIPLLFMGGILGRLFREFSVTIVVAILISGVVSVTLTPMLCSRFLRAHRLGEEGWFYRTTERFFDWMLHVYDVTLQWTLRRRALTLAFSFVILVATGWLFLQVPKGFIPSEDTSQILAITEAAQGASHLEMMETQKKLAEIVRNDPNVESFMSSVGGGSANISLGGPNFGRMFMHLKPRHERALSADELIESFRPRLNNMTGMRVFLQNPPVIRVGGTLSKSLYQFTLLGTNIDELYKSSQAFEKEVAKLPALMDVTSDLQIRSPQMTVQIERDRAAKFDVTPEQIETALFNAYGPRWISTIYAPNNQYRVLMEVDRAYQSDPSFMSRLYVKSGKGELVPLDSLARLEPSAGPQTINHYGQLPAVTVSFNLRPGMSLGNAVDQIEELSRTHLPATITTIFQGTAQAFQKSMKNLGILLLLAVVVVYIVLGVLYESFIHPLTILSGLPSAGFGALLTLWLFKLDLNIYSYVGLILLIGIVKKNAIMQIDFALEAERHHGKAPLEAIYEGCLVRFRPIMMTTMAALLGALPIAFGYGAGGEARRPLGLCVVGGLVFSQVVTLYLTPVVYTYLAGLQARFQRRGSVATGSLAGAAAD